MPFINYSILQNGYDIAFNFIFHPSDFLMFPKANKIYEYTYCELGFWALSEYSKEEGESDLGQSFALGQIFIVKYKIIINTVLDDNGDVFMTFYSLPGGSDPLIWDNLTAFLFFIILQIVFLAAMSKKKFERLSKGEETFKQIARMHAEVDMNVTKEFKKQLHADK
jgi:hypothetical protein